MGDIRPEGHQYRESRIFVPTRHVQAHRNRQQRNKDPVIDHSWDVARIALSAGRRITLFTLTCYGGVGIIRRAAVRSQHGLMWGRRVGGGAGGGGGG